MAGRDSRGGVEGHDDARVARGPDKIVEADVEFVLRRGHAARLRAERCERWRAWLHQHGVRPFWGALLGVLAFDAINYGVGLMQWVWGMVRQWWNW